MTILKFSSEYPREKIMRVLLKNRLMYRFCEDGFVCVSGDDASLDKVIEECTGDKNVDEYIINKNKTYKYEYTS